MAFELPSFGYETPQREAFKFSETLNPQFGPQVGFDPNLPSSSLATPPSSIMSRLTGRGIISDPSNMSFSESLFGGVSPKGDQISGWGMPALQTGKSLFDAYQGFQGMKTAKDTLAFQKGAFSKQFEAQRRLINNELRDRDAARRRRDPSYKSTTQFA